MKISAVNQAVNSRYQTPHATTETYDYILKVSLSSIENLEDLIITLKRKFGVIKSQTVITLTEHKFSPSAIPEI